MKVKNLSYQAQTAQGIIASLFCMVVHLLERISQPMSSYSSDMHTKKKKKASAAHTRRFVSTIGALEIANFLHRADTQRYFIFASALSIWSSLAPAKMLS